MSPHFITTACLDWNDQGTPIAAAFDDVYFSNDNGLAESRYVFLQQNALPNRWRDHDRPLFVVAETGFGTGLNVLATWQAFLDYRRQHPQGNAQRLHLISVEKYPLNHADLGQALAQWPELSTLSERLLAEYPPLFSGCHRLQLDENVSLDLWLGDVNTLLPTMEAGLSGKVDAWYLDGFAPSKNPQMWTPTLFSQLARLSRASATLATFTAATLVRRGLIAAGFEIHRVKGFAKKREMLAGTLSLAKRTHYPRPWFWRRAGRLGETVIVGAGIAGASLAWALTRRGLKVTLIEQSAAPAQGASGNRQAAVYPLLNGDHDQLSQFYLPAFLHAHRHLSPVLARQKVAHDWCGVVQLAYDKSSANKISALTQGQYPLNLVTPLSVERAQQRTGLATQLPGLEYPLAGWLSPSELTHALLEEAKQTGLLQCRFDCTLHDFSAQDGRWHLNTNQGERWTDNLILANSHHLLAWSHTRDLALSAVRGQVNYQSSTPLLAPLKTVVCYGGYVTPAWQGLHCIGASYERDKLDLDYQAKEEWENYQKLRAVLPELSLKEQSAHSGRVSIRATSRDHLPMVGAVPNKEAQVRDYRTLQRHKNQTMPLAKDHEGLYVLSGLGSRGVCSAPLLAEILAAQLCDEPYPSPTLCWIA
ncbi:bifunctional tRNA (5-methylaminomethyl-2-thiouridine)(34)-methyltransferase MnmD/FAD-dependent 5-carboxymethylaminomethyl-2-thiouridine(34) oxidoreductase MnmC [Oceanisphaera avium]|uniref:bifunctional tRNA (5-methylaminomethyl-2-thiouridine)(34)-methyltransferase MnmD/FAD-dependent 5-carboxymethylaminomethyl-2-thiouridine(34) oxidoreductase MnmC n=1 Tax=Oceanisphaera avium TaxID=1903694 RepID=UPI001E2ACF64|nr:bifunctional tRNA (5-methylaminomethyl-2-thiouridine)(34)-methyltransferase MnmD/FAD-dependent 5-carboxymethylaminomethyl-2-thiouridine(34) oxidoreductase MnmC [Oceanisphaera avium]